MTTHVAPQRPLGGISLVEFVVLMAALQALGALGIDAMLPNLPAIGSALGVADENRRQLIITAYLLGFGGAQLIFGPLADRYGRKPVLLAGLSLYVGFSLLAAFAPTFDLLLVARVLQGIGAAATRSIPVSVVRDRYAGREMARVMSLTSMVFMAAPIVAPSLGQLVLVLASWPWIFALLAALALVLMLWSLLRLPETLHPEDRLPIRPREIAHAFSLAARNRTALCYILGQTFLFGGLLGFINSSQQVFAEALGAGAQFPLVFAICASFIAAASLLNARLVMRLGMRRLSHAALLGYIAVAAIHLVVARSGHETLVVFAAFQAMSMFCFGLTSGNFAAMAMEPMGHIAGVASSFQGFVSMVGASLIGFAVGQAFDGTVVPMEAGYLLCGLCALAAVLTAERGRLFQPHEGGVDQRCLAE
ncbi:multidrug effflux MFS transporter [Phenylobacterium sp. LjRoot225]|uniref:multidrug effflux MFS transporter n=1 Tax=Phenylobacterium sp. LjRoot225 TaxID=3342285 RepID=UPI003ECEE24C